MSGLVDDKCLIDACRAGKTEAFGVLVRRYQDRLYPTVLRLTGCADDFLGVVLRDWARVDPAEGALEPPGADLARIVADRLAGSAVGSLARARATAREAVTP